jgi:hypothetical protein
MHEADFEDYIVVEMRYHDQENMAEIDILLYKTFVA